MADPVEFGNVTLMLSRSCCTFDIYRADEMNCRLSHTRRSRSKIFAEQPYKFGPALHTRCRHFPCSLTDTRFAALLP